MHEFNEYDALAAMREVAAKQPKGEGTTYGDVLLAVKGEEWSGTGCANFHRKADGSIAPLCIVGQAVYHLVGEDGVKKVMEDGWGTYAQHLAELLHDAGVATFTDSAIEVLGRAQYLQDNGDTWGEAIAEAESYINR